MRWVPKIAILLALPLLILWGCSTSKTTEPTFTGTLSGTVVFHGTWPDSGAVQLSLFSHWFPDNGGCSFCGDAGIETPLYTTPAFHDPFPNNGNGPDTVTFSLPGIALGTYQAAAVRWRKAGSIIDFNCDAPTIGLYGAQPPPYEGLRTDSLPTSITFTADTPTVNIILDAYLSLLPFPGCNDVGHVEGTVRLNGDWPTNGIAVLITSYEASAWQPLSQVAGRFNLLLPSDSTFWFTPPYGSYFVSVWTNTQSILQARWLGSYGTDTQVIPSHLVVGDADPDAKTVTPTAPWATDFVVPATAPAPHWISGIINFYTTRPPEGLKIRVSTQPMSPVNPDVSSTWGSYVITDPNLVIYALSGMNEGTYYVSVWNNAEPPNAVCYGAYGYTPISDISPDPVTISQGIYGADSINVTVYPSAK